MKRFVIVFVLLASGWLEQSVPAADPIGQPAITVKVLYDNSRFDRRLDTDWGFACLVSGAQKTILFDTGAKGRLLLGNMEKMNVKPGAVEVVVISHNHGDHAGGLLALLERQGKVTAYLPPSCPKTLVEQATKLGAKVVVVTKPREICPGVFLVGPLGDKIVEQALAVATRKGLVVIAGCSHPGVVEIVTEAKKQLKQDVYMVCGGMHLLNHSESAVKHIIARLKDLGVQAVGPTHCTGEKAIALFKEAFGDAYIQIGAGKVLQF